MSLTSMWLDSIRTIASVGTAVIAFVALKSWQRQDRASRKAEFLDALIDATHAYIADIRAPLALLDIAKIGMASHAPTMTNADDVDGAVTGAIAYIQGSGSGHATQFQTRLEALHASAIRLRALAAKGQVFGFTGYATCHDAITMLTWQGDRIEAFATVIGSPTWNWQNPEVVDHLKAVMAIEPVEVRGEVGRRNVEILEFSADTYRRIYG